MLSTAPHPFATEMVVTKIEHHGGEFVEVTLLDDIDGRHEVIRNGLGDPIGPLGLLPEAKMYAERAEVHVGDRFLVTVARASEPQVYVKPPESDAR